MKVLVSGATGLVGRALCDYLVSSRTEVLRLSRAPGPPGVPTLTWDPAAARLPAAGLEGVDAVVHLAGETILGRWTAAKKARIRDSRVQGTGLLSRALPGLTARPRVLVCASAVGIYGDRGDQVCTEDTPPGDGFLAEVCRAWEAATAPASAAGIRVVHLRIGLVLSPWGGALSTMLPAFRLGLGGRLGPGSQYVSWITLDDLVRVVEHVLERADLSGPVNAVAPEPVTNRRFTRSLARALGRPALLPVPALLVRALLGQVGRSLLLASTRVEPRRLAGSAFDYVHADLDAALVDLVRG